MNADWVSAHDRPSMR